MEALQVELRTATIDKQAPPGEDKPLRVIITHCDKNLVVLDRTEKLIKPHLGRYSISLSSPTQMKIMEMELFIGTNPPEKRAVIVVSHSSQKVNAWKKLLNYYYNKYEATFYSNNREIVAQKLEDIQCLWKNNKRSLDVDKEEKQSCLSVLESFLNTILFSTFLDNLFYTRTFISKNYFDWWQKGQIFGLRTTTSAHTLLNKYPSGSFIIYIGIDTPLILSKKLNNEITDKKFTKKMLESNPICLNKEIKSHQQCTIITREYATVPTSTINTKTKTNSKSPPFKRARTDSYSNLTDLVKYAKSPDSAWSYPETDPMTTYKTIFGNTEDLCNDALEPALVDYEPFDLLPTEKSHGVSSDTDLRLKELLESIHLDRYWPVMQKEQIRVEDIMEISTEDWQTMAIPIGPRSRIRAAAQKFTT